MKPKLIKIKTGFYLWKNPLDKSQELLGATVPIMNDNGVDLREYILSLKNCQEIENGYDLDELAYEFSWNYQSDPNYGDTIHVFKEGFQKALEILGDKKFSEKDMINFAEYCKGDLMKTKDLFNEYKSLQQTEWDVEIEMVKEEYIWSPPGEGFEDQTYRGCREVPKLDADGCLILKLKL